MEWVMEVSVYLGKQSSYSVTRLTESRRGSTKTKHYKTNVSTVCEAEKHLLAVRRVGRIQTLKLHEVFFYTERWRRWVSKQMPLRRTRVLFKHSHLSHSAVHYFIYDHDFMWYGQKISFCFLFSAVWKLLKFILTHFTKRCLGGECKNTFYSLIKKLLT